MKKTLCRTAAALAVAVVAVSYATAESPWELRAQQERIWRAEHLTLIPHEANYFLPFTYNTSPHATTPTDAKHIEAKFQISFKVLLMNNITRRNFHWYFGYTQLALWQFYNRERSAPFRDVNYEPETFLRFDFPREMGAFTLRQWDLGASHQSNGVDFPDSRTWNRIYGRFFIDRENYSFTVKPWLYIPDGSRDNRDISSYMGYGDLTISYARKNHLLSLLLRNNLHLRRHNRGAMRVDYSWPLTRNLTGLAQYFSGYGESLVDYNRPSDRFSVGLALSNWH